MATKKKTSTKSSTKKSATNKPEAASKPDAPVAATDEGVNPAFDPVDPQEKQEEGERFHSAWSTPDPPTDIVKQMPTEQDPKERDKEVLDRADRITDPGTTLR